MNSEVVCGFLQLEWSSVDEALTRASHDLLRGLECLYASGRGPVFFETRVGSFSAYEEVVSASDPSEVVTRWYLAPSHDAPVGDRRGYDRERLAGLPDQSGSCLRLGDPRAV
ncbi:hypothetical protein MACH15_10560 [Maricaulis maris]|nr:hypothetical protein MACH15_10560 [Maricaulis maris]